MIKYKTVVMQTETMDKVVCNRCGEDCPNPTGHASEYAVLKAEWGLGSGKDGEAHEAHLCEVCFDEVVAEFKIPPTKTGYL